MNSCVIGTHHYRLKNLIDMMQRAIHPGLPNYRVRAHRKKIKHCAILLLSLTAAVCTLSMVYEGELRAGADTTDYYTKDGFGHLECMSSYFCKLFEIKMTDLIWNIYFIRHGEGTHNEPQNYISKYLNLDPGLTETGVEMAKNAGRRFSELVELEKVKVIFASDLRRTRDTVTFFWSAADNSRADNANPTFCMLPCSHEISHLQIENLSLSGNENLPRSFVNASNTLLGFDRSLYDAVFNAPRGRFNDSCSETSMIQLALCYLAKIETVVENWKTEIERFKNRGVTRRIWTSNRHTKNKPFKI
jgi:hypothetical protein